MSKNLIGPFYDTSSARRYRVLRACASSKLSLSMHDTTRPFCTRTYDTAAENKSVKLVSQFFTVVRPCHIPWIRWLSLCELVSIAFLMTAKNAVTIQYIRSGGACRNLHDAAKIVAPGPSLLAIVMPNNSGHAGKCRTSLGRFFIACHISSRNFLCTCC